MITAELAEEIAHRQELVARVVHRHQDVDVPVEMRGVCEYSGWCGCRCTPCRVGIAHRCGHRKGCHKNCRSL